MTSFFTLRSLVPQPQAAERCELCGTPLLHLHRHLIDPIPRRLICACDACTLLFCRNGETKYKSVPRNATLLRDFQLSDGQWDSLMIPIGLAFFFESSTEGRVVALYPSPAGPTECLLSLDAWADIVAQNPELDAMESDVEALLANRLQTPAEYYLAPMDKCYELVGLIRRNWRGLSGGSEVWSMIRKFFVELKEDAGA